MKKNYLLMVALLVAVFSFGQNPGDLIFTEIMQNPNAVPDNMGEWFEIYNTTTVPINLSGYDIVDDNHTLAEEGFSISETLMIPAGGFLLFANNGDPATNGGIMPDFVYDPSLTLGNGTDGLTIQQEGNIIDIVVWDNGATFPDPNGRSMSLNPANFNNIDNDDGTNWCEGNTAFGTQFGTPGAANDVCGAPCTLALGATTAVCETITNGTDTYTATIEFTGGGTETFTITVNEGTVSGDDPSAVAAGTIMVTGISEGTDLNLSIDSGTGGTCHLISNINSPVCDPFTPICANIGDLIFTEIMQNPNAVPDNMGEWFEIYNTTGAAIDLHGYDIIDDNHTLAEEGFTISETLMIPAGGFLVFANNGDTATNGGISVDWVYDPSLTLGNGTDGITVQCGGNIIDIVVWDNGATFPDPSGKSMNLSPDNFNSADNDDGTNWCEATSGIGTQFGTPGAANDICGAPCTLELGTTTAACETITDGTDTYTATIEFTGGGTETFTVTVNEGTVSGDDPSLMAAGTIMVTGITEGTDLELSVDSGMAGTCHLTLNINSPVCDPFTPACGNAGDLIFTEIMQNPNAVSDDMGEWFEIYNTTGAAIDLHGFDIIDDNHTLAEEGFTISETLMIPAGGFFVFANNGDMATNGGVSPDWVYDPSLTLGNGTDGITVQCGGNIIDIVVWDNGATFPDPSGKSMNLSPASFNATANDDGINWCEAISQFATDFGTPGAANDDCGAPCLLELGASAVSCDAVTDGLDTYTATLEFTGGGTETYITSASAGTLSGDDPSAMASGTITVTGVPEGTDLIIGINGGTCILSRTIASAICVPATCAAPGSVILTEIMQNPSAVPDGMGEWFELYNTTAADIDLQGWAIMDDNMAGEGFTIATSLIIPAGGYLVFANNGDAATNGGITPDYVYDPSLTLGNGTDGLSVQCGGALIDIVIWDNGATFPDPNGASMVLATDHLNAADNNLGIFWGTATTVYGDGDFGTPGALNDFSTPVGEIQIEGLKIYPNPTFGQRIYITTENASFKKVELYNMLGERVYSTSFEGILKEINLGGVNAGVYFLKIKEGNKMGVMNLIVQ
ncbi:MAG TPA: T9SS type A sorting domain-containing protein [Bacteroidetes bacterium]|nr:T9SS type A sorting domain-containing protein [Bacteroidota bacterium]